MNLLIDLSLITVVIVIFLGIWETRIAKNRKLPAEGDDRLLTPLSDDTIRKVREHHDSYGSPPAEGDDK